MNSENLKQRNESAQHSGMHKRMLTRWRLGFLERVKKAIATSDLTQEGWEKLESKPTQSSISARERRSI